MINSADIKVHLLVTSFYCHCDPLSCHYSSHHTFLCSLHSHLIVKYHSHRHNVRSVRGWISLSLVSAGHLRRSLTSLTDEPSNCTTSSLPNSLSGQCHLVGKLRIVKFVLNFSSHLNIFTFSRKTNIPLFFKSNIFAN